MKLSDFVKGNTVRPVTVIKRDGSEVNFDGTKIFNAVLKAERVFGVTGVHAKMLADVIADEVEAQFYGKDTVEIAEIQNAVEDALMMHGYHNIARGYIEYRHDRDVARERKSRLNEEIGGLIEQSNPLLLNENANKDSKVLPTMRDLLSGIVSRHHAKSYMLPRNVVMAHERGEIHYHDLDYAPFFPIFNCMLIDLKGMLTQGFKMGNADIEPPKSIATAAAVTAQIIAQVASHIYGGNTINGIDTILAPYVRKSFGKHVKLAYKYGIKDKKKYAMEQTEKECYNAFQALELM